MENNKNKRKVIQCMHNGHVRYFVDIDTYDTVNSVNTTYKLSQATNFINVNDDEFNNILDKITSKPRNNINSIKIIEYSYEYSEIDYKNNDFAIKNAINKLSKEEIELLGLENVAFEMILKDQYNPRDNHLLDGEELCSEADYDDNETIDLNIVEEISSTFVMDTGNFNKPAMKAKCTYG